MIHHVFANKSNIGDWLSAIGIQSLLRGETVVEHLCDQPFVDQTIAALAKATSDDLIVIGGGGLFMDYFAPFWQRFAGIAQRVPFVIWGVGYCDLKQEPSRPPIELLQPVIDRAALCMVRDELTRRLLERPGLPAPAGCPSLCAIKPRDGDNFGLLHVDNYTTVGSAAYDAMAAVGEEFCRQTGRTYRTTNNRIRENCAADMDSLLHQRYAQSDLVFSSALHGCIIAVGMNKKVLAVSGDYKIEQFMDSVGLGEWLLTQQQALDAALVRQRLEQLPGQALDLAHVDRIRQQQQAIADNVKRLLVHHADK